jgi:arylsulfatase A-like enzyme
VARYDAEIRHVDAAFGEVLQELERLGRYRDALVIFTSDHGESLGEHDYYFEHGWFGYDATLRVPLMIKLPGQEAGGVVAAQVSLLDLVPTIGAVLGRSWDYRGPGGNLFNSPESRPVLAVESAALYPEKYRGLRSARWKYLKSRDGSEELYDLRADPRETENLASEESPALVELRARLPEILSALRKNESTGPLEEIGEVDARVREQLRALGYLE